MIDGKAFAAGLRARIATRVAAFVGQAGRAPGLAVVLVGVVSFVPPLMGKSKASKSAKELFAKSRGINLLAAARVALFGRKINNAENQLAFIHFLRLIASAGKTRTMLRQAQHERKW